MFQVLLPVPSVQKLVCVGRWTASACDTGFFFFVMLLFPPQVIGAGIGGLTCAALLAQVSYNSIRPNEGCFF